MYLMIFEDAAITKSKTCSENDYLLADGGIMNLFDISDPNNPKEYYQGVWHEIDDAPSQSEAN